MKAKAFGLVLDADLYAVQRASTDMSGAFEGQDLITGQLAWTMEMVVLGTATPGMADVVELMQAIEINPLPDASKSTFQVVRIADSDTCTELNAAAATLF